MSTTRTVTPRIKGAFVIFMVSATFIIIFIELRVHAFYRISIALDKRNFEMLRNLSKSKM